MNKTQARPLSTASPGDLKPTKSATGEWITVAALLVATIILRVIALDTAPPGVRFDELVNVKMADHIYAGEWPIYFQEAWGHEPLYHYVHAAGMWLLGQNVWGVRIASILFGTLGVVTSYLTWRQLFGRSVALLAATMLATSFWSLMYSRIGLRHISLPPWIGLSAYCYWRGLQAPETDRLPGLGWFGLGGLCLGFSLYTYFASRVVPMLFALFTLYLVVFHRSKLHRRWPGVLLFFALAALIVAPMVAYLSRHPEIEQRLGQVGGEILPALRSGDVTTLARTVLDTVWMFSRRGDPEWLYNIAGRPVFYPLTALFFYSGLLISLWRWRDPRRAFAVLWLAIGILPAMLSWPPGSLGHTIVAQPVTFVFPALALSALKGWIKQQPAHHRPWTLWATHGLTVLVVFVFVGRNAVDYFWCWPRFEPVRHEYQAPITATARYLEDHPEIRSASVSAPYVDYWNPWSAMSFDLFFQESDTHVRWFDGTQSIIIPAQQDALFLLPDHLAQPSELTPALRSLLAQSAQPVELGYRDASGSSMDIYRWQTDRPLLRELSGVVTAKVWASSEGASSPDQPQQERRQLALPLSVGNRLSFLGYRVDAERVAPGNEWELTTFWRVLDADSGPLAIFVHVLDRDNAVRAGWDGLYVSTDSWQDQDLVIHLHVLTLPADLALDTYRVEIGVYSPQTLQRLSIYTDQAGQTAPHARVLLAPLVVTGDQTP